MTTLMRDPSASRASHSGDASSTRRPSGARMRSIECISSASLANRTDVGSIRPARSTHTSPGPLTITSSTRGSDSSGSSGPSPVASPTTRAASASRSPSGSAAASESTSARTSVASPPPAAASPRRARSISRRRSASASSSNGSMPVQGRDVRSFAPMPKELFHVEQHGDVALVRIDRPPANAMDLELLRAGNDVRERLEAERPGAVVLTGRDGFFSAGVDLKLAPTLGLDEQGEMVAGINRLFAGWYSFPGPVVCAVNGYAIAGGLILALCADYRVCATEGRLGLTELRAGIPYPAAAMVAVRRELPTRAARLLVLEADLIDPQRAHELGVVDELAEPGDVLDRAFAIAAERAALPRDAYERVKRQLREATVREIQEAVQADPMLAGWLSGESAGAAAGILEGERP